MTTAVSSTTSPASTASASSATSTANSAATGGVITDQNSLQATYSQFLTLLTTQLQHQDPTSPMDTAQFTSQLVSFSQVEQQLKTNADLDKLVTNSSANQMQTALSYIGLDVSYQGNQFKFDPGTIAQVGVSYNLASAASSAQINIVDSSGNVVYSTNGGTAAGDNTFTWNGQESDGSTAPAGTYTVNVSAQDATGNAITTTTQVPGQVTGMQTASDGTVELVVGNNQVVPLANVTSAWMPSSASASSSNNSSTSSGASGG